MKYLIVGGVAGGATTAARLRRLDENSEIIMFERGKYISYANCGLPYYIGGTISDRDNLFVQTPETFGARFNLEVRTLSEVTSIFRDKKEVTVANLRTGESYTESYDKLVLSPGAEPVRPPLPGINQKGIFTLRNVPDTDKIKSYIEKNNPRHAVVVGAGFIGLEMAENLHDLGLNVTIVEMAEQVMTPLDYSMAALVHQHLKTKNVEFYLNTAVSSFGHTNGRLEVKLSSTRTIETDLVILSIGVRPDSSLAKNAGLEIGETNGIVVNEHLQTSDEHIYALGDAIEFTNPVTKTNMITYLAGPANKQGRILADNLVYGNKKTYKGAINTAIAKVFDLTVASAGVSGKMLGKLNIPHIDSIIHTSSHAGYYPGALPMSVKISFAPDDGRLLGAQIVGYDGVDKRIDLFSSAIQHGATVYDLSEIEHAYAPPFASAKDPVNIAGMVAENILQGVTKMISWREINEGRETDLFLLDIRTADEYELGSIEGAVSIPLDELRNHLDELPRDKIIVAFCGVGLRAHVACRILMQHGFEQVYNLSGGLKTYETASQKQSNEDIFANDYIGHDDHIYQGKKEKEARAAVVKIDTDKLKVVNACGLQCPGPVLKLKQSVDEMGEGETLRITASDAGFYKDVQSWANVTGNEVLELTQDGAEISAIVRKGKGKTSKATNKDGGKNATLVCFSDDLDKALATFVIANGAVASGKKVTIFFTFWGLNVIKRQQKTGVKKDIFGKMFGMMMPSSSKKLGLSKMNMGGMGRRMMRTVMKDKQVDSLENMIKTSMDNGVEFVACQMSMDVMGVKAEEFIDGVQIGGVASYLERTEDANLNLFV
ncbi:MAG: FAD-dependent oxidoreductase [Prolixibacteraceae bacterium]|jgi:NADPH-dependent 2,4-dienoyl-CoA reductase/sulfur reductase-like enzyme/peroxiredoxin family protein/rhodanese-related sulfurtransferase/TusA-related sulfurtransferase|nr:FAD-dependent oxidoreductase [Prolixibacteraceae bacterium]